MSNKVNEALENTRMLFNIEEYPGNLFDKIMSYNLEKNNNIIIFKEDLGPLSGFIGYKNTYAAICINCKRNIAHQNFTLAHEIGHYIMHFGTNFSETGEIFNFSTQEDEKDEKDANEFASELLYPTSLFENDLQYIKSNDLLNKANRKKLGFFIDELCHKYFVSYSLVLNRICFACHIYTPTIKKEIENAIGGKISKIFDIDFYTVTDSEWYKPLSHPYDELHKMADNLAQNNLISIATAESIQYRYRNDIHK